VGVKVAQALFGGRKGIGRLIHDELYLSAIRQAVISRTSDV